MVKKENKKMELKMILAVGGTITTFLIGGWHVSLTVLAVFMVIDFLTGMAAGAYNKQLKSAVGFRGILKKGVFILVIILANMLDILVGSGAPVFRTMAVFFYIGNEGISILENLDRMGIPIPEGISKYIHEIGKEENIVKKLDEKGLPVPKTVTKATEKLDEKPGINNNENK
ncbi:phage holin family protein [Halobacillus andaensis]|uniref:phage holin family protein n=1 Tax=Halobacillus andaensis TaxID=1176239 RepID=UPI003D7333E0